MPVVLPPVLVLALLLILLGTQLAYVIAPGAPHYLLRLGLSTLAVGAGEALGLLGVGSRLALGELHPLTDVALLVLFQLAGTRWLRRQPV